MRAFVVAVVMEVMAMTVADKAASRGEGEQCRASRIVRATASAARRDARGLTASGCSGYRSASGNSIFTCSTSRLSCFSSTTLISSGLIDTYFEITAISWRCSAGR